MGCHHLGQGKYCAPQPKGGVDGGGFAHECTPTEGSKEGKGGRQMGAPRRHQLLPREGAGGAHSNVGWEKPTLRAIISCPDI